jgi:hypothetical protein
MMEWGRYNGETGSYRRPGGRTNLFGFEHSHLLPIDPATKYWD